MPWTGVIDGAMVGVSGGVAAFGTEPVLVEENYIIPDGTGRYLIVNSGKGTVTVTLPDPDVSRGYDIVIKATDVRNGVEIIPHDGEFIDGKDGLLKIMEENGYVRLVSDGQDWHVIG